MYSIQISICIIQTNFNYLSFQLSPTALAVQKHTDGPVAMQIDHTLNMSIAPCVDDKMAGNDDKLKAMKKQTDWQKKHLVRQPQ